MFIYILDTVIYSFYVRRAMDGQVIKKICICIVCNEQLVIYIFCCVKTRYETSTRVKYSKKTDFYLSLAIQNLV